MFKYINKHNNISDSCFEKCMFELTHFFGKPATVNAKTKCAGQLQFREGCSVPFSFCCLDYFNSLVSKFDIQFLAFLRLQRLVGV